MGRQLSSTTSSSSSSSSGRGRSSSSRRMLLQLLLLSALPLLSLVSGDEIVCQEEWRVGSISSGGGEGRGSVCLRVEVGGARSWREARRFCHRAHSHLLNLDTAYLVKHGDAYLSLAAFLLDIVGVNATWLGMERRHDRLQLDGFPGPSNFSSQLGQQGSLWGWGEEEPGMTGRCGVQYIRASPANPSSKEDQSDARERSEEQTDPPRLRRDAPPTSSSSSSAELTAFTVAALRDCQELLPFVCVADQIPTAVHLFQNYSVCGQGYGSYLLEQCYDLQTEGATYRQAVERCRARGGNLAMSNSQFLRHVTNSVFKQISEDRDETNRPELPSKVWVYVEDRSCHLLDTDDVTTRTSPCNASLPYLCQRPVPLPGPPNPRAEAELASGQGRGDVIPINARNLTLELTPVFLAQPISDANNLTCRTDSLVPDIQEVTWYKNGRLHARGVTLSMRSETIADADVMSLVGVYWCEVVDLRTGQRSSSNSVFVTMKGFEIYAAEVEVNVRQGEELQLTKFSLTGESFPVVERMLTALGAAAGAISPENSPPFHFLPLRVRGGSTLEMYAYRRPPAWNQGQARAATRLRKAGQAIRKAITQSRASTVFDRDTLQVRSLDFCPASDILLPEVAGVTVRVEDTPLGGMFILQERTCSVDGRPLGKMPCLGDKQHGGYWGQVLLNPSCDFDDMDDSTVSSTLRDLAQVPLDTNNLDHVVSEAVRLTRDPEVLSQKDVIYAADILGKAVKFHRIPAKAASQLLELGGQVSRVQGHVLDGAQARGRAANRLLEGLDTLGSKVEVPHFQRLQGDMAAIEVWNMTSLDLRSEDVIGLQLRNVTRGAAGNDSAPAQHLVTLFSQSELDYDITETAIILPKQYLRRMYKGSNVQIVMHVYSDPRLFRASSSSGGDNSSLTLNSKVIAAQLLVNGQPVSDLGNNTVITIFRPSKSVPESFRAFSSRCAYWNFTARGGAGGWETRGCRYSRTIDGRDVCQCNHLTNFAILLDMYGQTRLLPEEHQRALSIISILGLSLSMAGLAATIVSFLAFGKLRQGKPQQTLFQLAVALLCACVVFLAGVTQTQVQGACVAVAALLHYFLLASFLWMLMEAVLQYLLFVRVFGIYFPKYILKTSLLAWGVPLIPVITVLSIDYRLYLGGPKYCWLSVPTFYYAFALPLACILLTNLTLYILVALHICRRSRVATPGGHSDRHQALVNLRANFCCFVVLGLTWVFGYFALEDARLPFQYLFALTNTTQGLLIFLLFTARDKGVREHWRALCCGSRLRKGRNSSSSSSMPRSASKVSSTSHERLTGSRSGSDQLIDISRMKVREDRESQAY